MRSTDRARLDHWIEACLVRGRRPIPLPHCAICARYAHENLAFEAILAILGALPAEEANAVAEEVEAELADLPSDFRQQLVNSDNLAAQMDDPSWRLVRSLVIDLYGSGIQAHFADTRLEKIEQITLLGGAYGGPDISASFMTALVDSPAFANVRKLTLHSGDMDKSVGEIFWGSNFAARLEHIDGVPFEGNTLPGPLEARVLRGLICWDSDQKAFALPRVVLPEASPKLESTTLSLGWRGGEGAAEFLQPAMNQIERIPSVELSLGSVSREQAAELNELTLPNCVDAVTWHVESRHDAMVIHDCDHLTVFREDVEEDLEAIRATHVVTDYDNCLFELGVLPELSPSLKRLRLIASSEHSLDELLNALERFPALDHLVLMFPLTYADAQTLAASPVAKCLESLQLVLSLSTGFSTTTYMKSHAPNFVQQCSESQICELVFGDAFRDVANLTIVADAIEISRSPNELQHVTIGSPDAATAISAAKSSLPINLLTLATELSPAEFQALASANVFGRVERFVSTNAKATRRLPSWRAMKT